MYLHLNCLQDYSSTSPAYSNYKISSKPLLQPLKSYHQSALRSPGCSLRSIDWYAASEESFVERVKHILDINDITAELGIQNYKRKFNNLICWEEKANIEALGIK